MRQEPKALGDFLVPVRAVSPLMAFGDEKFTYLDIASVDRGSRAITASQDLRTTDAPSRARQLLAADDVIVSTVRPNLNTVAWIDDRYVGAIASTGFCVLRADPQRLDARFLFHWISSDKIVEKLVTLATGASYPAVSDKIIKSLRIELPPLNEQKRLAAILDKAAILCRKRQQAIRLADNFLRAVFLEMFGDPERNPLGFPRGTIRDLVESANYGTSEKANEQAGELPILRMNNITYEGSWDLSSLKFVDLDLKIRDRYLARKGDILFNRTNSVELVGKTAVYEQDEPMAIAGYLVRVRLNASGDPYYVAAYLNSKHGKSTLRGIAKSIVGMANINAQEMQNIAILLPPAELQRKYGRIVQQVRAHLKTQQHSLDEIQALTDSLTSQCFGNF